MGCQIKSALLNGKQFMVPLVARYALALIKNSFKV